MAYTTRDFLTDVAGYGEILAAFEGQTQLHMESTNTAILPDFPSSEVPNYLQRLHAFVACRQGITIYRWFDTSNASMLGSYWSPARPGPEIDDLGLSDMHMSSRDNLAMKYNWNDMEEVVEAKVRAKTILIVGRAAPQSEGARYLGGGGMQFYIPSESNGGILLEKRYLKK